MTALPPPPIDDLAEQLLNGRIIPFLGAGASSYTFQPGISSSSLPDGKTFATYLAERAKIKIECEYNCHTGGCRAKCERHLYDLARISSYYQLCVATRELLNSFISRTVGSAAVAPNSLHDTLARIAAKRHLLIITTNYDNLVERAFDRHNLDAPFERIEYDVVATAADQLSYGDEGESGAPEYAGMVYLRESGQESFVPTDPNTIIVDLTKRSLIYKIHGSVGDQAWPGGFLITEDDYCRFLGRMQGNGLIPPEIVNEMRRATRVPGGPRRGIPVHSLLFLGYGMNDWNLRVLLQELRIGSHAPGEEIHYAIMRNASDIDARLLQKRGITPFEGDLADFVKTLNEAIDRLS